MSWAGGRTTTSRSRSSTRGRSRSTCWRSTRNACLNEAYPAHGRRARLAARTRAPHRLRAAPGACRERPAGVSPRLGAQGRRARSRSPIGTAAQSIPVKEEAPQTFETVRGPASPGRAGTSCVRALTFPQTFDASTRSFYIKGTAANLKAGDPMLLVTGATAATPGRFSACRRSRSSPRRPERCVTLQLNPPALVPDYLAPSKAFGELGNSGLRRGQRRVARRHLLVNRSPDALAHHRRLDRPDDRHARCPSRYACLNRRGPAIPDSTLLRASAAPFGHNAPLYASTPP